MSQERIGQIKSIFDRALEVAGEARAAFLDQACGEDLALRVAVEALLGSLSSSPQAGVGGAASEFRLTHAMDPGEITGFARRSLADQIYGSRYKISRELGRGGFGVVYLAEDIRLHNRQVVLKVLLQGPSQNPWAIGKFEEEIQILARINHPGVVTVIGSGETPFGSPFIAMEYVEGESLRELLNRVPMLPLTDAAEILRQTGSALSAAHSLGVCHRDLKPENILIHGADPSEYRVKLIDFGIATLQASSNRQTSKVIGTLPYMSPEQLEGRATSSSDVYALGIIAYELVSGTLPYEPTTAVELYKMQQARRPLAPASSFRGEALPEADQLIAKAMSLEPENRFPSAREFTQALASSLLHANRRELAAVGLAVVAPHLQGGRGRGGAGRLVSKMCDRRAQEDDFRAFFVSERRARPGVPQFYVVSGIEGECHSSLVERLSFLLEKLSPSASLCRKNIPWQYDGSLNGRRRRLLSWLFEQFETNSPAAAPASVPQNIQPAKLSEVLNRRKGVFYALQHDIRAGRWDESTLPLLKGYADFLSEVQGGTESAQLAIFLNVIYPSVPNFSVESNPIARWWSNRRDSARKARIRRELTGFSNRPGCLFLEELKPVTKEDVMEWLEMHNILDSEEQRIRVSDELFQSDGRILLNRPMSEVEGRLHDLHVRYAAGGGSL
jgi:serine/threonine protein kinase